MNELHLIKLLLTKAAFDKWFSAVDLRNVKEQYREVWYIYQCLQELHTQFPDRDFTLDELATFFWAKYPDASVDAYRPLFDQLTALDISADVGDSILAAMSRREALLRLSEGAYKASQGQGGPDELAALYGAVASPAVAAEAADDEFITTNIEEIVNETVSKPGIRWRLGCLNKAVGSLRQGDFGFVFARPETGKTTFIADVASGALDQVDQPVIWFNNEEQDNKVMLRVVQSYFGIKLDVLLANARKYNEDFNQRVGNKFLLVNSSRVDITRSNVERILEARRPALIIYDQIDKIKGFKADRDDLVYGAIYQWARELAKKYAPTIGVCQADGSGEGQKWLSMANVANAKTSKQAEADFILGIGKTHDEAAEYVRYINISKNKLMGDADSEPSLRHGRFETIIEPEIARYRDVVNYG